MKIYKLYTLSQFVDYIEKTQPVNPDYEDELDYAYFFVLIAKYNDFLKQPLKKEMFVFIPPFELDFEHKTDDSCWSPDEINAWQAAEKKVIFKGWEYHDNKVNNNSIDWYVKFDKYIIHHHTDEQFALYISGINNDWLIKSLHDLAEATKGQLELKNVEL